MSFTPILSPFHSILIWYGREGDSALYSSSFHSGSQKFSTAPGFGELGKQFKYKTWPPQTHLFFTFYLEEAFWSWALLCLENSSMKMKCANSVCIKPEVEHSFWCCCKEATDPSWCYPWVHHSSPCAPPGWKLSEAAAASDECGPSLAQWTLILAGHDCNTVLSGWGEFTHMISPTGF